MEQQGIDPARRVFDEIAAKRRADEAVAAEAEKSETAEPADDEPEQPPADERGSENTAELDRAKRNLALAGVPEKAYATLDSQEIIDWWSSLAKTKAEVDKTYRDRADLQRQLEEFEEAAGQAEPENAVPAASLDLKEILKPIAEDDETLSAALEQLFAPLMDRLAAAEQALQAQNGSAVRREVDGARDKLVDRFPELEQEDVFDEVVETMAALGNRSKYNRLGTRAYEVLMEDAIRAVGVVESAANGDTPAARKKRAGPDVTTRRMSPKKSADPQRAVYDWLQRHPGDVTGARKFAGLE